MRSPVGLEPLVFSPEIRFANIGERCNVAGSIRFKKMVVASDWGKAAEVAQNQVPAPARFFLLWLGVGWALAVLGREYSVWI